VIGGSVAGGVLGEKPESGVQRCLEAGSLGELD
jgi:hypothetical protein